MLAEPAKEMLVWECWEYREGGRISKAMRGIGLHCWLEQAI
jgi:hypothetical protein